MTETFRLINATVRANAVEAVRRAPEGFAVSIGPEKRSADQNAKLWAILNEIAEQVTYHGLRLSAEDFKILFMDALHRETRLVPNTDNNGFVALGRSSSTLTKTEFADLITIATAWADQNGVTLTEVRKGDKR